MVHAVFDLLASLCAMAMTVFVYRWRLAAAGDRVGAAGFGYALALVAGAVIGAYLLGTLNLIASGQPGIGRSIIGALAGAITGVELYKWQTGLKGSTGVVFVPGLTTTIAVGRIGCFLSGLEDMTHGTPTAQPWGVDFGDGIRRHPVQLYETAAMALFLGYALVMLARRDRTFLANGFYLFVAWYAAQRFIWEFLKPYGAVAGPFNIFHIACAGLIGYALVMWRRVETGNPEHVAAP